MTQSVQTLKGKHKGETAYIVGCGPSLILLNKSYVGYGPVIAISNAIKKVESLCLNNPIYSFQKDAGVIEPEKASLVVNEQEYDSYSYMEDYEPRYQFLNERDFNIPWNTVSALTAVHFAKLLGCNRVAMLCCDVNVTGDMRTCIFNNDGSYEITEPNFEYYVHKRHLADSINELDINAEWICPKGEIAIETKSPMKLVIATPFYEMKGWSPYIKSLFDATYFLARHTEMEFDFWEVSGASYVSDARNNLANRFLYSDYTHILFIDSDESWDLPGLVKILVAPYELVGAGYACKNMWDYFGCLLNCDECGRPLVDHNTGLISTHQLPGGFLRIAKTVFEKLKAFVSKSTAKDSEGNDVDVYDFFSRRYPHGEDASFLMRCVQVGVKRWLEPRITITHWGVKGYSHNYHEFLCQQPGGIHHVAPDPPQIKSNAKIIDILEELERELSVDLHLVSHA